MLGKIWNKNEPYIIAEISQNHDGSLGQAHAFIDAVATTGADAIKFQTHIADEESTNYEPFRVKFSYEDKTRYDYWKRMEFTKSQWKELKEHANFYGLDFLSSPFSAKALELLDEIGVPAWKFGAGEVFNDFLLDKAINTGKPILLSTGLSTLKDIENQVNKIKKNGNKLLLFQCTTAYPSTADMIDINLIDLFKKKFKCSVGISDHSGTIYPSLAAITLGASVVEVHVTMSKYMFGPDVKASVDIEQLKQIVEGAVFISKMRANSEDINVLSEEKEKLRKIFSKSFYVKDNLIKGTVLSSDLLSIKKPNMGVPVSDYKSIIGKKIKHDIKKGEPLKMEDIE